MSNLGRKSLRAEWRGGRTGAGAAVSVRKSICCLPSSDRPTDGPQPPDSASDDGGGREGTHGPCRRGRRRRVSKWGKKEGGERGVSPFAAAAASPFPARLLDIVRDVSRERKRD